MVLKMLNEFPPLNILHINNKCRKKFPINSRFVLNFLQILLRFRLFINVLVYFLLNKPIEFFSATQPLLPLTIFSA